MERYGRLRTSFQACSWRWGAVSCEHTLESIRPQRMWGEGTGALALHTKDQAEKDRSSQALIRQVSASLTSAELLRPTHSLLQIAFLKCDLDEGFSHVTLSSYLLSQFYIQLHSVSSFITRPFWI